MKNPRAVGVAVAALLLAAPALGPLNSRPSFITPAEAQRGSADISIFFDRLGGHGRWVETDRHGFVFIPSGVAADWRPYTDGHWVYTKRHGWMWVSDEPWSWACYHYGRWGFDNASGWFWVPGNTWAPAWVSWQTNDDYIGWAPLPPYGSGYAFSADIGPISIGVGAWRFVETRYFVERDLRRHYVPLVRNDELLRRADRRGHPQLRGDVVVAPIVDVDRIQRVTNRDIEAVEVVDAEGPSNPDVRDGRVRAYRPELAARRPERGPANAERAERMQNRVGELTPEEAVRGPSRRAGERQDGDQRERAARPGRDGIGGGPAGSGAARGEPGQAKTGRSGQAGTGGETGGPARDQAERKEDPQRKAGPSDRDVGEAQKQRDPRQGGDPGARRGREQAEERKEKQERRQTEPSRQQRERPEGRAAVEPPATRGGAGGETGRGPDRQPRGETRRDAARPESRPEARSEPSRAPQARQDRGGPERAGPRSGGEGPPRASAGGGGGGGGRGEASRAPSGGGGPGPSAGPSPGGGGGGGPGPSAGPSPGGGGGGGDGGPRQGR